MGNVGGRRVSCGGNPKATPHDSADKAAVCGRLSPSRREYQREITVGEQERRAAPTPLLAGRDALTRRRRIRERPGTDPRASRVAGAAPVPAAARVPPSAGRGVARFAAPPTPVQSAPRGAAARRSADTPGHRAQTFAASTRPTDTHRPGTARRGSRPRQPPLTVPRARHRHHVPSRDERGPPRRARGQDAVVENQVDPRPRRQHGEPLQQLQRIEPQVRRPVRPAVPQREPDLPSALTCSRSCASGGRNA